MKPFKLIYLLPLLLFSFCTSKDGKDAKTDVAATTIDAGQTFTVKGTLSNYKAQELILQEMTTNGLQPMDTAAVDAEGNFTLSGFIREKTFAIINLGQYRNVFFVIDTTSNIEVDVDGGEVLTYTVKNSPASEDIAKIANLNTQYNQKIIDLNAKTQSNPTMSEVERAAIEARINAIVSELQGRLQQEIKTLENPLAQIFAIEMLQVSADRETEESILKAIETKPTNKWFTLYRGNAQARIQTAVGSKAPDITLNTPQGTPLSLSSLKGKYVLIDFWASWCRPCRAENPNVVRVYNKYKSKGFEILGISLDKEAGAWAQAIAADGLTWKHISDLGGWQSIAAQQYKVTSIPQTLLLDKEGVIIAKNLRGAELEAKLSKVFN